MKNSIQSLVRCRNLLLCVGLLLVAAAGPLFAGGEGRISAIISDQDGEPLADVIVTLRNEDKRLEEKSESNKKGRVRFALVDATGTDWVILLEKEGYQPVGFEITLVVGGTLKANWTLERLVPVEVPKLAGLEEMSVEEGNRAVEVFNEGAVAFGKGEVEVAIERFQTALELAPELAQAHSALLQIYSDRGEHALAAEEATRLLELKPGDLLGLQMRYDSVVALGKGDEAVLALEALIAADPGTETALRVFNQGAAVLRSGDEEGAKRWFHRCLEVDPEIAAAHAALANMALTHKDYDTALSHAAKLQEIDAGSVEALAIRYEALRGKGDEEQAKATFAQIQALDPALAGKAFYTQGVALFNAGNNEQAAIAFDRALSAVADHARSHYMLGLVNLNSGKTGEAKRYLLRFIELSPNDPDVATAREMLGFLE